MKKFLTATAMLMIFFVACKRPGRQISHDDITLMAMPVDKPEDKGLLIYKVSLVPSVLFTAKLTQETRTALAYHMDSCFYLESQAKKIYPVLLQPIANGQANRFEYLVEFEHAFSQQDTSRMIYKDKYLNGKLYQLTLTGNE